MKVFGERYTVFSMKKKKEQTVTVRWIVSQYGVTAGYIRRLIRTGHLTPAKMGPKSVDALGRDRRMTLIPRWQVEALVENGTL